LFSIRDLLSLDDYAACLALQEATWGVGFSERVPTAILRVSQMIGGVTAGAFDDGTLLGFVFGMTGLRDGELVHWSDMLAVREHLRGQGIGARLKQYQREKVLALGVKSMLWTYDPLQARNANFNVNILGAMPVAYQPDMYGSNTGSALHGTLPTDRFIVKWDLHREDAHRSGEDAVPADDAPLPVANPLATDGLPIDTLMEMTPPPGAAGYRVQVPRDFTALRTATPHGALRWRMVVRGLLTTLFAQGYSVSAFRRTEGDTLPYYVLRQFTTTPVP